MNDPGIQWVLIHYSSAQDVVQLGQEEGKSIDVSCEDDYTDIRVITTITDDVAKEREIDDNANKIIGKFLITGATY